MIEMVVMSGTPDAGQRGCTDCRHCQAAVSWWCVSPAARKARGTGIPGVIRCRFWEPAVLYRDLPWWRKLAVYLDPFAVRIDCTEEARQ